MIDYSFSMQSCKSSLSTVQWPFCKGRYAGTNDLSKWQQSILTLHQGLLILQVIRLINDPGAEIMAEPALIMLKVLHLGSARTEFCGFRTTSPAYRWLLILRHWKFGQPPPGAATSLYYKEMMHGNCSSYEPHRQCVSWVINLSGVPEKCH